MVAPTRQGRTSESSPGVAKRRSPTTYEKDLEAALDAHIRSDESGATFDQVGLALRVDGETVRRMCDPSDRLQLGASRLLPMLRRLGTPEPFNAYCRLEGNKIGGVTHQLLPVITRADEDDLLTDLGTGSRELGEVLETVIARMRDGHFCPTDATVALRIFNPYFERMAGIRAQLEAFARREPQS